MLNCDVSAKDGVANADAIAAVDGVDAIWIGQFDLSVQLGIPGNFSHPEFLAASATIEAAAKKHNKDAVLYRTYPLLYHKFGNMVFVRSGNLYSLCNPGNQDYQKIIHL